MCGQLSVVGMKALFLYIFVRGIFFFLLLSGSYQWPADVCLISQSGKLYLLEQREEIRQQWGTASVDASSSVPLPAACGILRDKRWLFILHGFFKFLMDSIISVLFLHTIFRMFRMNILAFVVSWAFCCAFSVTVGLMERDDQWEKRIVYCRLGDQQQQNYHQVYLGVRCAVCSVEFMVNCLHCLLCSNSRLWKSMEV